MGGQGRGGEGRTGEGRGGGEGSKTVRVLSALYLPCYFIFYFYYLFILFCSADGRREKEVRTSKHEPLWFHTGCHKLAD